MDKVNVPMRYQIIWILIPHLLIPHIRRSWHIVQPHLFVCLPRLEPEAIEKTILSGVVNVIKKVVV